MAGKRVMIVAACLLLAVAYAWAQQPVLLQNPTTGQPADLASETATVFHSADLDETAQEASDVEGCLAAAILTNQSAAALYFKFYNADLDVVVVGTTAPTFRVRVAAGATEPMPLGSACWSFANLTIAATTDLLEDGTPGAPAANDGQITLFLKE
jgi:hypothetical protein